jgi:glycerate kinase
MRIIIAPDSFKESLSAAGVAHAIAQGVRDVLPYAELVCVPMADGGEGSLDAVLAATGAERRVATVSNANGDKVQASWGWLGNGRAFVEVAEAAGLEQIASDQRNALTATSFGVGQLISCAVDSGARHIVIGLGGSACNDAGAGLLQALGVQLLDASGLTLPPGGAALRTLDRIDISTLDSRLAEVTFELAVDVDNPLCGPRGASAIFGPQKGASPEQVLQLDEAIAHFASYCAQAFNKDYQHLSGMGAAGGLGFAVKTFFNASFRPGVELVAELAGLPQALQDASLVFTGEGRMDEQTLLGKTPAGVARYAQARGIPVFAIAGSLGEGYQALYNVGITAAFSLAPGPVTLAYACENAADLLKARASDCMRVWVAAGTANSSWPGR